jgi:hypothetical protein
MDIVYTILRELAEPPSLDACRPLEYPGEVGALEQWRVVPTENGPYLLEGLLNRRGICSVVFAVYGRALARIAERWVVLGRPLDGHLPEYDDADVIRRAAHWIVRMDAREHAECTQWGDDPEGPTGETEAVPLSEDEAG